jgi:FtsP/CotA-like multicopper oxidase with cupredoxin domain
MPDLRDDAVARRRTVQFSTGQPEPNGTPVFLNNGRRYEQWGTANLAPMRLGTVEEWTLTNTTDEYHPFHIHVQPFQVVSVNGQPVRGVMYRDTVTIPPMVDGVPGRVVIRQRYPDFTGRFVIHCHILFHEDHGMVAPVRVVR